jgi:dynein assembly factor 1
MELSVEWLKSHCKEERMKKNDIYSTPSLNDKLYLHYKGFRKIQALEEYIGLKVIWLEGNGLEEMGGLENQTLLRTLYLHENCIHEIKGLESLVQLDTLNLSKNFVTRIDGLGSCTQLQTLLLAHNHLTSADDVRHILKVPSLVSLDVQHNRIDDVAVLDIFSAMPNLKVLYLMGNPVVKDIKHYRKAVLAACPSLKYLDDRPVFEDERRRVTRWKAALDETGDHEKALEAERDEIRIIREEKREAEDRNFRAFDAMVRTGLEQRRAREAGSAEAKATTNDGERLTVLEETPALRVGRENRLVKLLDPYGTPSQGPAPAFFAAGAFHGTPDASLSQLQEKLAKDAELKAKIKSMLSSDIWLSHEAADGDDSVAIFPPPPPPRPPVEGLTLVLAPSNSQMQLLPPPPPPPPPPLSGTNFDELD